jgi:hypothetical protein
MHPASRLRQTLKSLLADHHRRLQEILPLRLGGGTPALLHRAFLVRGR